MASSAELFTLAVRHHQSGNLADAEALYRQVLQVQPSHFHAYHLLGVLANQTGHHEIGISLIRQAIALNPLVADFHSNLGLALLEHGQFAEGADCLRQALHLNPHDVDTHNSLGNALVGQGQVTAAAACFRLALQINPNSAKAHYNLGNVLLGQGQLAEAAICFQQALRLDPNDASAHNNLGSVYYQQDQFEQAVECYGKALRINPNFAEAHNNLGNVLKQQKEFAGAADCFRQALRLNPDFAIAHFNLGNVLHGQGRFAAAVECYREALRVGHAHADAFNNLGNALKDQGDFEEAARCFHQALRLNPDHVNAHNNLGNLLVGEGHLAEAAECYRRALALDPSHDLTILNRAHLRLLQGDFHAGWQDYERRWTQARWTPRPLSQPRWDGSSLVGKSILVLAEQGLGDTIQFMRYLTVVKERGGMVYYECPPALTNLAAGMAVVDRIIVAGEPLPPFDMHIPLMSLPGLVGTTLATIPANIPYLRANPDLVERWRDEIECLFNPPPTTTEVVPCNNVSFGTKASGAFGSGLNVGIVWQGSMQLVGDPRSVALANFEPLARVNGVNLVSLQVGPGARQLGNVSFPVADLGRLFNLTSLDDIAAALRALDLVVTIDTAVAHLAGALGVAVWVALPVVSCWRWLLERQDSPWYPTMRLFRQRKVGAWKEIFESIAAELGKMSAARLNA